MSKMAYQQPIETSMDMITSFGGYNHNLSISDGEFYDTENLTTEKFPLVSERGKRVKLGDQYTLNPYATDDPSFWNDMVFSEWLITENDGIYAFKFFGSGSSWSLAVVKYDETNDRWAAEMQSAAGTFSAALSMQYAINMGAQIVIFPAKIVYNTIDKTYKMIDTSVTENISITLVDHNDTAIPSWTASETEPTEPENGDYWLDTSNKDYVLKRYSEASGMWATVQTYARIVPSNVGASDAFEGFEENDAVNLSWVSDCSVIHAAEGQKSWVIYKKSSNKILVPVMPNTSRSCSHYDAVIKRTMPAYDYIVECNNRLWACRYGDDGDGETVNELFACKLGDPTNWNYFSNTSVDSYFVSLGTGGRFTGVITYQGNPVFFKEDSVHRIYGYYPANFQLKSINGYGVADGSHKSLVELNDTVYYLSNTGIVAYRGSVPISMGEMFGPIKYKNGIAAGSGNRVYFSLQDSTNNRTLFAYDDRYGIWYREDELAVEDMFTYNSRVFCKTASDIVCLSDFAEITSYEPQVPWSMDTGKIGFNTPWRKFITRMTFRMRLKLDATAAIYIMYDSDGRWIHVTDLRPLGRAEAMAVPVTPRRCDHFNIKIQGRGEMELISITKFYEESNDYV